MDCSQTLLYSRHKESSLWSVASARLFPILPIHFGPIPFWCLVQVLWFFGMGLLHASCSVEVATCARFLCRQGHEPLSFLRMLLGCFVWFQGRKPLCDLLSEDYGGPSHKVHIGYPVVSCGIPLIQHHPYVSFCWSPLVVQVSWQCWHGCALLVTLLYQHDRMTVVSRLQQTPHSTGKTPLAQFGYWQNWSAFWQGYEQISVDRFQKTQSDSVWLRCEQWILPALGVHGRVDSTYHAADCTQSMT